MLTVARHLREATAAAHAAAEHVAVGTGFLSDPDAYRRYLRALHAFHVGIEASFDSVPELSRWVPDIGERKKQAWLAADLAVLGGSPLASVATVEHADVTSALGALYVVEGATLGGRWILAHLSPAIPTEARSFFHGYGAETAARFKSMCRGLEEHVAGAEDASDARERMGQSAAETFVTLRSWIESRIDAE